MLAEFGDDPHRYADARARKNYAGTAPITRASGKKTVVAARYVRNKRLADALHQQALCSLSGSPGARAYYDRHRDAGTSHHKALRALSNRLVGILHGCLWASPRSVETSPMREGRWQRHYRKFDEDFKQGAVRIVRETGKPIAQVARELGINEGTLGNWCAKDRRGRGRRRRRVERGRAG